MWSKKKRVFLSDRPALRPLVPPQLCLATASLNLVLASAVPPPPLVLTPPARPAATERVRRAPLPLLLLPGAAAASFHQLGLAVVGRRLTKPVTQPPTTPSERRWVATRRPHTLPHGSSYLIKQEKADTPRSVCKSTGLICISMGKRGSRGSGEPLKKKRQTSKGHWIKLSHSRWTNQSHTLFFLPG